MPAIRAKPVRWSIQVVDDPRYPDVRRTVGEAVTASSRRPDGWFELTSQVELDAGGLLKGTPFVTQVEHRGWRSRACICVDPSGNLHSFDLEVKSQGLAPSRWSRSRASSREARWRSSRADRWTILNQNLSFDYEPRSVVQDVLGPLDRLPGLHVGQRWESQVINPFTGQVESRAGRGRAAGPDPLGRQPGDHLRGGAAHASACR